jgi:hypothetical protein
MYETRSAGFEVADLVRVTQKAFEVVKQVYNHFVYVMHGFGFRGLVLVECWRLYSVSENLAVPIFRIGNSGKFLLVLASTMFPASESRGTHDHILLSRDSGNHATTDYSVWGLLAVIFILHYPACRRWRCGWMDRGTAMRLVKVVMNTALYFRWTWSNVSAITWLLIR